MLTYLYSLIWGVKETNSLCPNSFNSMPSGKFHNFAIQRVNRTTMNRTWYDDRTCNI